jgi:hypothetical protein
MFRLQNRQFMHTSSRRYDSKEFHPTTDGIRDVCIVHTTTILGQRKGALRQWIIYIDLLCVLCIWIYAKKIDRHVITINIPCTYQFYIGAICQVNGKFQISILNFCFVLEANTPESNHQSIDWSWSSSIRLFY